MVSTIILYVSTQSSVEQKRVSDQIDRPASTPPSNPSRPVCQKCRAPLAAGKSDAELEHVLLSQIPEALAEEMVHMAQTCAIVGLAMGVGTWATVALVQGLPYIGVALAGMRYRDHTGNSCPVNFAKTFRKHTRHFQNLSEPFRTIWC